MVNQSDHPVAWSLMLYSIDDVREHVASMLKQMSEAGHIDEEDFRVQIGHIYAHLNRIWHSRNSQSEEISDEEWTEFSEFPTDLKPVG